MTAPPIRAVLFDLDDTLWPILPVLRAAEARLADWLAQHAPAVAQGFPTERLRAMRQELLAAEPHYALDLRRLRRATLETAFAEAGAEAALIDHAMQLFNRARNAVTPYDDVLPLLGRLGSRVKLGSISNGVADLEEIGLARHFHFSIAAHQAGCTKPDPAIFLRACEALDVAPAEAVYIGDDPLLDVEGAQRAGLAGVWLKRPDLAHLRPLPEHVRPDGILASLDELEAWLAQRV